jgi:hypothetical protein
MERTACRLAGAHRQPYQASNLLKMLGQWLAATPEMLGSELRADHLRAYFFGHVSNNAVYCLVRMDCRGNAGQYRCPGPRTTLKAEPINLLQASHGEP